MEHISEDVFFHNEEVCDILSENKIVILRVTPLSSGKVGEPSFCAETKNGLAFIKFSKFERFSPVFLSEIDAMNQKIGNQINTPEVSKDLFSIHRQINIYRWLPGENIRTLLSGATIEEYRKYGSMCGTLMRSIHQPLQRMQAQFNVINRLKEYMMRIRAYGYQFEHSFDYEKFLLDNLEYIIAGDRSTFIHLDFKPKNIMLIDNKPILVDIDSCSVGDPWLDFYDKAFGLFPLKEAFNVELLRAYFRSNIPECFWMYFMLLSIFALIQNTAWLLGRNELNHLSLLESYLWENYKGFTETVPQWYNTQNV